MSEGKSKIGYWIGLIVLATMLFGSCMTNIGLMGALLVDSASGDKDYPVDAEPEYDEIWSSGYGETKVVRIELAGVIMRGRRERLLGYEPDRVEQILSQIRAASNDADVKAILLEVDSPGGAVTPSDEIYTALCRFKESDEERVIGVLIRGLGASGAYYAAMAGDFVMAEPTAIVGSVGVIMQTLNMKELGEKVGLKSVTIASGKNKDMLNLFEEVNPQHVSMLKELVDSMQNRFATIVETSRELESRDLLDGRVFNVNQALEHRLIDAVGYWDDAIDELEHRLGVEDLYVIRYAKEFSFFESMMESKGPALPDFTAVQSPRFLYLWKP